jgi:hypothetical protein
VQETTGMYTYRIFKNRLNTTQKLSTLQTWRLMLTSKKSKYSFPFASKLTYRVASFPQKRSIKARPQLNLAITTPVF